MPTSFLTVASKSAVPPESGAQRAISKLPQFDRNVGPKGRLTMRMGQTHVHRYTRTLLDRIQRGDIDPSFVISHRFNLSDAPVAYETFLREKDDCVKVVMKP